MPPLPGRLFKPAAWLIIGLAMLWAAASLLPGGADTVAPVDAVADPYSQLQAAASDVAPLPASVAMPPDRVELGRLLFHDRRLSKDDSVACASCHPIDKGGMDGSRVSTGISGRMGDVNAPTVLNSGFSFRQFWDGRAVDLEEQAAGPVHNPLEMASDWNQVMAKLRADSRYDRLSRAAYGRPLDAGVITSALANYQRTLVTPDAPFDQFLRGNAGALGDDAIAGWALFRDLGCVACHQGVNLGGNLYSNLGVMGDYFAGKPVSKADLGRYNVTGNIKDKHLFKVPTLRNVALTGPYFHDGGVESLDEAVKLMARYQLGLELPPADVQRLVAFLHSLNGRLPR